jgi:predicted secreted hydrolase
VVHGTDGVSQKAEGVGRASHYYSLARLEATGRLALGGREAAVQGLAWMDHEFGSNQLGEDQVGWDWFSLQLEDGSELMLYRLRLRGGATEPKSSGTLVRPDGTWRHLPLAAFRLTPLAEWRSRASGGTYPVRWRVEVPGEGLDLTVSTPLEDQELRTEGTTGVTYWEGAVEARGTRGGRPLRGRGYLELTGYAAPFDTEI